MSGFWYPPERPSFVTIAGGEADLDELAAAAFENMAVVDNTLASDEARDRAYDEAIAEIRRLTGKAPVNPYYGGVDDETTAARDEAEASGEFFDVLGFRRRRFGAEVAALAEQHPGNRETLLRLADVEPAAERLAFEAGQRFEELRASRPGIGGFVAALAGGIAGSLRDPVQVATLMLGGGPGAARTVAGRIARTALTDALVNGAAEAALQPMVQDWRAQVGLPAGWAEAARNTLFAAALGGAFGAGGRAASEGLAALRRQVPDTIRGADELETGKILEPIREALDAPGRGAVDALEAERAFGTALAKAPAADDSEIRWSAALAEAEARQAPDPQPSGRPAVETADVGIDDPAAAEAIRLADEEWRTLLAGAEARGDLEIPVGVAADADGNLVAQTARLADAAAEIERLDDLAALVASCKV